MGAAADYVYGSRRSTQIQQYLEQNPGRTPDGWPDRIAPKPTFTEGSSTTDSVRNLLSLGAEALAQRETEQQRDRPAFVCCYHRVGTRCFLLTFIMISVITLILVFAKGVDAAFGTEQPPIGTTEHRPIRHLRTILRIESSLRDRE